MSYTVENLRLLAKRLTASFHGQFLLAQAAVNQSHVVSLIVTCPHWLSRHVPAHPRHRLATEWCRLKQEDLTDVNIQSHVVTDRRATRKMR